eukprot:gene11308-biopygen311
MRACVRAGCTWGAHGAPGIAVRVDRAPNGGGTVAPAPPCFRGFKGTQTRAALLLRSAGGLRIHPSSG